MKSVLLGLFLFTVSTLGAGDFPLSIKDAQGYTLVLPAPPQRIVSLTLFSDEILFDLLLPGRFAGVTDLAVNPEVSNVAEKARKVPRRIGFHVESLVALRPDLVLAADWSDAGKVQQLRQAGVPVFLLATPVNKEQIEKTILLLSRLTGEDAAGRELITSFHQTLTQVQAQRPAAPLSALDYNTWGAASGRGTSWNEMLSAAGLKNAAEGLVADRYGQVPLSKEALMTLDPDLLILPTWTYGEPGEAGKFYQQVLSDRSLSFLKALRNRRVYQFPERLKSTVSHYWAQGVEALAALAYPRSR